MVISKTPLRISFVGGGTDFKDFYSRFEGRVISATIDKYIYVIVKERFDDLIVLHYTYNEIVNTVDEIKHDLIREALRKVQITKGIEITTLADIPSKGSGLGSSSSLTVGLLNALYNFKGVQVTAETLAREACEIEIDILKQPIGKQDQYIAAYGGIKKICFLPGEAVSVEGFCFNAEDRRKLRSHILLHFTNITRKADTILGEQKANIESKINELQYISNLVPELEACFNERDFDRLGLLLKKNWEFKKSLAQNVTNGEINKMVELAMNSGAIGCKISGAGGGGFLMSYVPTNVQDIFRRSMSPYRELPFTLEPFGSRIMLNARQGTEEYA